MHYIKFLLIEETQDLASRLFATRFLVSHDSIRSGKHNVTELSRRQEVDDPLLNLVVFAVESGRDDSALVEAADELDDDLLRAVVVDDLEFADVAVLLHARQEFDDHFGGGADQDLSASPLFRVRDCL